MLDMVFCDKVVQCLLDDFAAEELIRCPDRVERTAEEIVFWLYESVVQGQSEMRPYLFDIVKRAGDPAAMVQIGEMFWSGAAVERSERQAFLWFEMASRCGNAYAMMCIGWMYIQGIGVERNVALGVQWLRLAAEEQYEPAGVFLSKVSASLSS